MSFIEESREKGRKTIQSVVMANEWLLKEKGLARWKQVELMRAQGSTISSNGLTDAKKGVFYGLSVAWLTNIAHFWGWELEDMIVKGKELFGARIDSGECLLSGHGSRARRKKRLLPGEVLKGKKK